MHQIIPSLIRVAAPDDYQEPEHKTILPFYEELG
jgi:hypothetical protein